MLVDSSKKCYDVMGSTVVGKIPDVSIDGMSGKKEMA